MVFNLVSNQSASSNYFRQCISMTYPNNGSYGTIETIQFGRSYALPLLPEQTPPRVNVSPLCNPGRPDVLQMHQCSIIASHDGEWNPYQSAIDQLISSSTTFDASMHLGSSHHGELISPLSYPAGSSAFLNWVPFALFGYVQGTSQVELSVRGIADCAIIYSLIGVAKKEKLPTSRNPYPNSNNILNSSHCHGVLLFVNALLQNISVT